MLSIFVIFTFESWHLVIPSLVGLSEHYKFLSFAPVKSVWQSCPSLSLGVYPRSSLNVHLHHRGNIYPTEHGLEEKENRRVQIAARKKQVNISLKYELNGIQSPESQVHESRLFSQSFILASYWQFNPLPFLTDESTETSVVGHWLGHCHIPEQDCFLLLNHHSDTVLEEVTNLATEASSSNIGSSSPLTPKEPQTLGCCL